MPESDFERQLATLLRQTAAEIPPDSEVASRVHHQLLSGSGGQGGGRRWIAAASMVAVVALLIGTLIWFRGMEARPGAASIALHVDAAYADATATVVTFHITGPRTDVVYSVAELSLTDAVGNSFPIRSVATGPSDSYALFAPLPQPALGGRQALTVAATQIWLQPLHLPDTGPPTVPHVSGLWQVRLAVTPVAGTSTPLHVAAQTHNNLSILPLRLDVSPGSPSPGNVYLPGGLRIVLQMSGLTPGTRQFPDLATAYTEPGGGGASGSGGQSSLSSGGGSGMLPAFVFPVDAHGVPLEIPGAVGTAGSIELELIYLRPPKGPLTLTFETITLSSGKSISGPWVFTITGG
jgi:hypothetical protein